LTAVPAALSVIDHQSPELALKIHAVRMAAYRQEAELLGLVRFPPMERELGDILDSSDEFLGAFADGMLAGVLSLGTDEEGRGRCISSLVVRPDWQRRGLGQALLQAVIGQYGAMGITVQTAAENAPALSLYARCGFQECRRWVFGSEPLQLVKLSRPPSTAPAIAMAQVAVGPGPHQRL
jgi:GNAT superfamily N-acetyltransferase